MAKTEAKATSGRGRPGYSRDEVVAIAVDEFLNRGYDATSMGILAQRLGSRNLPFITTLNQRSNCSKRPRTSLSIIFSRSWMVHTP